MGLGGSGLSNFSNTETGVAKQLSAKVSQPFPVGRGLGGKSLTTKFDDQPNPDNAPVAFNVQIAGIFEVGETLTASYQYFDPNGNPQSGSIWQWYASFDDVVWTPISAATALMYLVGGSTFFKYVRFGVIPSDGVNYGAEAFSSSEQALWIEDAAGFLATPLVANTSTIGVAISEIVNQIAAEPDLDQGTVASQPTYAGISKYGRRNRMPYNAYNDASANAPIAAAGSELIPDGLFVSDMGGFTNESTLTGTAVWSNAGGVGHLEIDGGLAGIGIARIALTTVIGEVYMVQMTSEVAALTRTEVGTTAGGFDNLSIAGPSVGGRVYSFTATATTTYFQFRKTTNGPSSVYVVSFRQQRLPLLVQSGATALSVAARQLLTVVATGTQDGLPYYDLRVQIPVTGGAGTNTNYYFINSATSGVAALTGETWSLSAWFAVVAGTLPSATPFAIAVVERTAAGGAVGSAHSAAAFAVTATLAKYPYDAILLDGGATTAWLQPRMNFAFVAGAITDYTLRIAGVQEEISSAATGTQIVTASYDITETGIPNISCCRMDSDWMTYGVTNFGAATAGFRATAADNWTVWLAYQTINNTTTVLFAQTDDADAADRMFTITCTSTGAIEIVSMGGTAASIATGTNDGLWHFVMVRCTAGVVQALHDVGAWQTVTPGVAVAEAVNITAWTRFQAGSANSPFIGGGLPPMFIDRALSDTEAANLQTYYCDYLGVV